MGRPISWPFLEAETTTGAYLLNSARKPFIVTITQEIF